MSPSVSGSHRPAPAVAHQRQAVNQTPPLLDYNVFRTDRPLQEATRRWVPTDLSSPQKSSNRAETPGAAEQSGGDGLEELGRLAGTAEAREHGRLANACPPVLRTHDRFGNRIDEVDFHPSWHWLMGHAVAHGLQGAPWVSTSPGAHVRRAAGFVVWSQTEPGHLCPISMTYAAVPALRTDPEVAARWVPRLAATAYDPGVRDPATKTGCLAGMGMTEKQGGSDVRSNSTEACPLGDGDYALTGHKWFTSAPMNDVFLMLAQAPGGLTCFAVPRVLPDGSRNRFDVMRLKDKLGNRSNASSELEFHGTVAHLIGEEGAGVRTIIEMVAATRLDCVLGSTALLRRALTEATWHATHRTAFGARLIDQPLMTNVLADLAVETEAATVLAMRLAAAVDRPDDPHEQALRRIGLPLAKLWVCKRTAGAVAEAMECLGGNGYAEDSGLPLLYREAPVNSIWEGSGNVQALDVLRALGRDQTTLDAWITEVGLAHGTDPRLDAAIADTLALLGEVGAQPVAARRLAARMAACLQGSLLVRYSPTDVADAFCATRLGTSYDGLLGTLPVGMDTLARIAARSSPVGA